MTKKEPKKIKKTKAVEVEAVEVVETPVEAVEAPIVEESEAKRKFRANMELYKTQNPAKYETKEKELLEQLSKLN